MEDISLIALFAIIIYGVGIIVLFIINFFYFLTKEPSLEDKLFEYNAFNYKYEDTIYRIGLMEEFLGLKLNGARRKLEKYHDISKRPLRKFHDYEEKIEDSMIILYGRKGGNQPVQFLFDRLSPLFKIEVFYTLLFFPVLLAVFFFFVEIDSIVVKVIFFLFWTIIVYSIYLSITRLIMSLKYGILKALFTVCKWPVGAIRRNMNSLGYLYHTSHFHRPLFLLMFVALISAFGGSVKGKSRGFGGGSFGGGGAGGGW